MYTGPWKVPARRRALKDKDAPKRPMSAFLAYSQARRAEVRAANPNMDNISVSRELAKMWKEAPQEEKQGYIDEEAKKREVYKVAIADYRSKNNEKELALRQEQEASTAAKLRNMTTLNEIDAPSSYRDASINHPLVAAAASSALAASRFARGYPSAETYGADYYGSASYPSSYGTYYSNMPWLAQASASAAAAAAYTTYAQQEEQAVYGNPYAGMYSGAPLMGNLTGSTGAYGGDASAATSASAYRMYCLNHLAWLVVTISTPPVLTLSPLCLNFRHWFAILQH